MRIFATLALLTGLLVGGGIYTAAQAYYSCTTTCYGNSCTKTCY